MLFSRWVYICIYTSYLYKKYRLGSFSAWELLLSYPPPTKTTTTEALKPPGACLQNAMKAAIRLVEKGRLPGLQKPTSWILYKFPRNGWVSWRFFNRFPAFPTFLVGFPGGNSNRFPAASLPGGGLFSGSNSAVSFREGVFGTSLKLNGLETAKIGGFQPFVSNSLLVRANKG